MLRPENRNPRNPSTHHRHFIATMQARAGLAVLEDLVRQFRLVFDRPETVLEEEIRNTREQAHRLNPVLFSFLDQRLENAPARALSLGFRLHYDRAHLAQVRPIKVQRAAAKKRAAVRFGDSE